MNSQEFSIAGRIISPDQPPYIIAEMSNNHLRDLDRALAMIDAAKAAGADAVKLQTFTADSMTIDCDEPQFWIKGGLWDNRRLYDLYEEIHLPWEWHKSLFDHGRKIGITIFSSPFDTTAVDFLENLDCPAYKIASFENVDLALIEKVADLGKPLIISTGLACEDEIERALDVVHKTGNTNVALLHCISAYPAPAEDANLKMIQLLAKRFNVVAGLSDHSLGTVVSTAAVAMGASIIEKHFTLSRSDGGPDAAFSLDPRELASLCADCRVAWSALGEEKFQKKPSEEKNAIFRRSLYVVEDIAEGDIFNEGNLRSIRPGDGLEPQFLGDILGKRAACPLVRGTPLQWIAVRREN